jgi:polynucleotide 5'-hydroxyl-kinase GRC3/NOL9
MKGEFHLLRGETEVRLVSGSVDVIGQTIAAESTITVPRGKSIILREMTDDCRFTVTHGFGGESARLESSPYPPGWEDLISLIRTVPCKRIMILGEMDTGKTFLCTYLANRMIGFGLKAGVIDCDLGQSDIGPPGCLGLSLAAAPFTFMADAPVSGLHFVGSHSPEGHLTTMVVGLHRLVQMANRESDVIFIDTCGWTLGDGARLLKGAKISVLDADLVVLLQRGSELEHLVAPFPHLRIFRLPVAKKSTPTDQMTRQKLREDISKRYFRETRVFTMRFDQIRTMGAYFRTGREIENLGGVPLVYGETFPGYEGHLAVPAESVTDGQKTELTQRFSPCRLVDPGMIKGALIGLLDGNLLTLGLGIVESIDFAHRRISFVTPVDPTGEIKVLAFGSLKYHPDGSEAGFLAPGQF